MSTNIHDMRTSTDSYSLGAGQLTASVLTRNVLLAKRDELLRRSKPDLTIEHESEPMTATVALYARDQAAGEASRIRALIGEIDAALVRLDRSEYGICVTCEDPIPAKRLDAVPWAAECISCRAAAEVRAAEKRLGVEEEI